MSLFDSLLLFNLVGLITGGLDTKLFNAALFTLIVYDYAITFEDEVRYFWRGPLSISQALFFFNRYFPIFSNFLTFLCVALDNPTDKFCERGVRASFVLNFVGIAIIQAILVTRVWFLFPGDRIIRLGLLFSFITSVSISLLFFKNSIDQLKVSPLALTQLFLGLEHISGCRVSTLTFYWKNYLPSLVFHTILYGLTVHQALVTSDNSKTAGIRKKLITDGGVFYLIVLCSVGFVSIGSFLTNVPQINLPAIFSPIILTTNSIATSRIMFSLRSIITNEEDSLEWIDATDGPTMPLSGLPSQRMSIFKRQSKTRPTGEQEHRHFSSTLLWSQAQLIVTPRPTLKPNINTDNIPKLKSVDMLASAIPKQDFNTAWDRYCQSPEELARARYGSIYDEEKGLSETYKRAMRIGSQVFF